MRRRDGRVRGAGLPAELRRSVLQLVAERSGVDPRTVARCYRDRPVDVRKLAAVTIAALEMGLTAPAWGQRIPAAEDRSWLLAAGWRWCDSDAACDSDGRT